MSYIRREIAEKSARTDTSPKILSFPLAQSCGAGQKLWELRYDWTKDWQVAALDEDWEPLGSVLNIVTSAT